MSAHIEGRNHKMTSISATHQQQKRKYAQKNQAVDSKNGQTKNRLDVEMFELYLNGFSCGG